MEQLVQPAVLSAVRQPGFDRFTWDRGWEHTGGAYGHDGPHEKSIGIVLE